MNIGSVRAAPGELARRRVDRAQKVNILLVYRNLGAACVESTVGLLHLARERCEPRIFTRSCWRIRGAAANSDAVFPKIRVFAEESVPREPHIERC